MEHLWAQMWAHMHNWYKSVCICKETQFVFLSDPGWLCLFLFSEAFFFFKKIPFSRGKMKQFIMLAAPQPIVNARGADQIKTEITVRSLCLEGTKTLVLILIEFRTVSLAYCIYSDGKEGECLSQHASVLFNMLFIIWSSLAFTKHPCRFHFVS